ncbi:MAG: hypothetical protein AAGJ46_04155 [Planctomycetota bacterium]
MESLLSLPLADAGGFVDILSRATHTICGGTLLGGAIYLRFVIAPSLASIEGEAADAEATLYADRRKAWALCVAACAGLLLLSGTYNLIMVMANYEKMPPLYHGLFGVKFLLALAVFVVSAMIAGRSAVAKKMQQGAKSWLSLLVTLTIAVFVFGAVLKNIPHVPITSAPTSEAPAFDADVPELPAPDAE